MCSQSVNHSVVVYRIGCVNKERTVGVILDPGRGINRRGTAVEGVVCESVLLFRFVNTRPRTCVFCFFSLPVRR